ncbi:RTA1 like protein-domain-containing protein [Favolaschia claudopus]|uniref:RTA1 like protein-domain-containing protein n=1 Tax=Favolaschia claudopus TaxID=2862362 RepID=A0AAW0EJK3_9AGAR
MSSSFVNTLSRYTVREDSPMEDAPIVDDSQYGYVPQESVAILFLVLFGISTLVHAGQAIHFRLWWLLPTAMLCGVGEIIGWTGRLWSSYSPNEFAPFAAQTCATIVSPTPLLAASFLIMERVVQRLGASYSRLTPKWYLVLFLPCDLIALVVQGVGGGLASAAKTLDGANQGADIMLYGIAFQFAVIIIFTILAMDFLQRYIRDKPVRRVTDSDSVRGDLTLRLKIMLGALAFSTTVLVVRSIYRLIELSDGWTGRIIRTEVYFNVLDGAMITLAIFTLNFIHPGIFLMPTLSEKGSEGLTNSAHSAMELVPVSE